MTKDTKIPQAARNFVDRFGNDAPVEARQRANELQQAGNAEGHDTWMLIYEQVKRLVEDGTEGLKHRRRNAGRRIRGPVRPCAHYDGDFRDNKRHGRGS